MQFWVFKLQLITFSFRTLNLINYLFLQVVKSLTICTNVILRGLARLITYTFLVVPFKAALTLYHIAASSVKTIAIDRWFMIFAKSISKSTSLQQVLWLFLLFFLFLINLIYFIFDILFVFDFESIFLKIREYFVKLLVYPWLLH